MYCLGKKTGKTRLESWGPSFVDSFYEDLLQLNGSVIKENTTSCIVWINAIEINTHYFHVPWITFSAFIYVMYRLCSHTITHYQMPPFNGYHSWNVLCPYSEMLNCFRLLPSLLPPFHTPTDLTSNNCSILHFNSEKLE